MNSPASLLSQLRIDRRDDPEPAAGNWNPRWLMAVTVSALVAGAVTWWILARSDDVPVRAHTGQLAQVTPQVAAKATLASAGTAALDTSGYVVARRQATVSSKATGRVAEVLIEEGQRVEKGQVIARLDSSSTAAALAEAEARLAQAQADLDAARIASDDAYPIYRRNEQQHAAGLISSQAFDSARAAYNATRASRRSRRQRSTFRVRSWRWRGATTRTWSSVLRSPASSPSRRPSRARSSHPCPPAAVSRAPASGRSSTWNRWKPRSTSARTSLHACDSVRPRSCD